MFSTTPERLKMRLGIVLAITIIGLSLAADLVLPAVAKARQIQEEREYKIVQPDWPEVLELVAVKNLQSESFPEDFEVVVKNIGSKPIYGIDFSLVFRRPRIGWHLFYGDEKFRDKSKLAHPTDIPINAGETGSLKLTASQVEVFKLCLEKGHFTDFDTKQLLINPQTVNFGDGTGYVINQPYPAKREEK